MCLGETPTGRLPVFFFGTSQGFFVGDILLIYLGIVWNLTKKGIDWVRFHYSHILVIAIFLVFAIFGKPPVWDLWDVD